MDAEKLGRQLEILEAREKQLSEEISALRADVGAGSSGSRRRWPLAMIALAAVAVVGPQVHGAVPNSFSNGATADAGQVNENFDYVLSRTTPPGGIMAFANTVSGVPPAGWLLCDGAVVSRTTYADLFAVIGEIYGAGDGTSTFALPDFQGRFLRGQGGNSDTYGVAQENRNAFERARIAWNEHNGGGNTFNQDWGLGTGHTFVEGYGSAYPDDYGNYGRPVWKVSMGVSGLDTTPSTNGGLYGKGYNDLYAAIGVTGWGSSGTLDKSPESRPDNYAVDFLIRYE